MPTETGWMLLYRTKQARQTIRLFDSMQNLLAMPGSCWEIRSGRGTEHGALHVHVARADRCAMSPRLSANKEAKMRRMQGAQLEVR